MTRLASMRRKSRRWEDGDVLGNRLRDLRKSRNGSDFHSKPRPPTGQPADLRGLAGHSGYILAKNRRIRLTVRRVTYVVPFPWVS